MADNPITTPLPADLPEQWTYGQTVGPNGTDVGLTQQHGYNYLMQQVNATQEGVNALGEAMEDLPDLEYLKNYESLYPVTQLPANTDLDTVTTPGVYYAASADISTILNLPDNFAGYIMLVVRRGLYSTMLHQEIYNWSGASTFSKFWRSKNSSADSWTEWIEEFTPVVDYHATSLNPYIDTITDDLIMVPSSHSKRCPVSGSWILIQQFFFQSVSVTSRRIQIAYGFPSASSTTNTSGMAIRRYSESSNTWSEWEKIYTSKQKPTAEDVGALPISGGTMTGPLTLSGDPAEDLQAAPKQYVDKLGLPIVTTEGDGAAYTATVPGITALTAGASFIMIPHTVSTTTIPNLNVNNLGAKNIKRGLSTISTSNSIGNSSNWLSVGRPLLMVYDGLLWKVVNMTKPAAQDLNGTVSVSNGGTGYTSITDTTYTTARYRASSLNSSDTTPSSNGVIAWTYE